MEEEIDIKELLVALWKKKIIIIIVTCIFLALGMFLYGRKTTSNSSVSSLSMISEGNKIESSYFETDFILARGFNLEKDGEKSTYKLTIDSGVISNLNQFATSSNFLEKVIVEMNLSEILDAKELKNKIALFGGTSDVITLLVAYDEEDKAAEISNRILVELTDKIGKLYNIEELILIDGPKKLDSKEVETLQEKLSSENAIAEEESKAEETKSPSKKKVVLVAAIGFILSCGAVIMVELFSSSVKNEESLAKATNSRVLETIPKASELVNNKIDLLRINLENYKTLLITSPEKNDGKTFIASRLAKSYEVSGKKAALVDARDLTEEKLNKLENANDVVIIDSENILDSANTLIVAKLAKGTILVSSEDKTKLERIIKAKASIEENGGNFIGNVLNRSTQK